VGIIVRHLRLLLQVAKEPDAAVACTIERIERNHGRGAMDSFVPNGLRTRQWQRRFAAATGLTPKAFARIARLQRLVSLYQSGQWRRWADLALESGFYDQAHLANDFREFAGQSPDAFFREGRGMTEFYRDGFFQDRRPGSR
jgi:methylphosphotriester-DNA--protein-cysteine methyltransferase